MLKFRNIIIPLLVCLWGLGFVSATNLTMYKKYLESLNLTMRESNDDSSSPSSSSRPALAQTTLLTYPMNSPQIILVERGNTVGIEEEETEAEGDKETRNESVINRRMLVLPNIGPEGIEASIPSLIQLCKEPPSAGSDTKYTAYCTALLVLWLMLILSLVIYQIRSILALRSTWCQEGLFREMFRRP